MIAIEARDVRPFVPAQDFEQSKAFYVALGWKLLWSGRTLALLENCGHRFYLQAYYVKEWADNCMLHISVDDAMASYALAERVLSSGRFPGARVSAPKREDYGALVTYVWDPVGVLLHLAQWEPGEK